MKLQANISSYTYEGKTFFVFTINGHIKGKMFPENVYQSHAQFCTITWASTRAWREKITTKTKNYNIN